MLHAARRQATRQHAELAPGRPPMAGPLAARTDPGAAGPAGRPSPVQPTRWAPSHSGADTSSTRPPGAEPANAATSASARRPVDHRRHDPRPQPRGLLAGAPSSGSLFAAPQHSLLRQGSWWKLAYARGGKCADQDGIGEAEGPTRAAGARRGRRRRESRTPVGGARERKRERAHRSAPEHARGNYGTLTGHHSHRPMSGHRDRQNRLPERNICAEAAIRRVP